MTSLVILIKTYGCGSCFFSICPISAVYNVQIDNLVIQWLKDVIVKLNFSYRLVIPLIFTPRSFQIVLKRYKNNSFTLINKLSWIISSELCTSSPTPHQLPHLPHESLCLECGCGANTDVHELRATTFPTAQNSLSTPQPPPHKTTPPHTTPTR